MSSSTSNEAYTSKIVTEEESSVSSPFEGDTIELTGNPLDRFVDQQFADVSVQYLYGYSKRGNYIK